MYLVDEEDGASSFVEQIATIGFDVGYYFPHFFHTGADRTQCIERCIHFMSDDFGQRSLAYSGRPPQNHGWRLSLLDHLPEHSPRSDQMLLPHIVGQRFWTHSLGQGYLFHAAKVHNWDTLKIRKRPWVNTSTFSV